MIGILFHFCFFLRQCHSLSFCLFFFLRQHHRLSYFFIFYFRVQVIRWDFSLFMYRTFPKFFFLLYFFLRTGHLLSFFLFFWTFYVQVIGWDIVFFCVEVIGSVLCTVHWLRFLTIGQWLRFLCTDHWLSYFLPFFIRTGHYLSFCLFPFYVDVIDWSLFYVQVTDGVFFLRTHH